MSFFTKFAIEFAQIKPISYYFNFFKIFAFFILDNRLTFDFHRFFNELHAKEQTEHIENKYHCIYYTVLFAYLTDELTFKCAKKIISDLDSMPKLIRCHL